MASITNVTDYERRAYQAYWTRNHADEIINEAGDVNEIEHDGLRYVVLSNVNGTLAVYRIMNQGQLRRLRRWPAALDG